MDNRILFISILFICLFGGVGRADCFSYKDCSEKSDRYQTVYLEYWKKAQAYKYAPEVCKENSQHGQ